MERRIQIRYPAGGGRPALTKAYASPTVIAAGALAAGAVGIGALAVRRIVTRSLGDRGSRTGRLPSINNGVQLTRLRVREIVVEVEQQSR